jgi:DNA-binding MarR family transcriptional regulator
VFVLPTGVQRKHSSTIGDSQEGETSSSVSTRPLFRTLYRLRWGSGRINKSRAAILAAVVECPTSIKRRELAERLGRKPESLKKPLKWLVDNGLLVHTGYGRYAAPEDLERRIEDARELAGEPLADRLQMERNERQRESYRKRNRKDRSADAATGPTEEGTENVQRSREARAAYEPPPPQATDEQQRRIAKLVQEGMRRDFAEESVLGKSKGAGSRAVG